VVRLPSGAVSERQMRRHRVGDSSVLPDGPTLVREPLPRDGWVYEEKVDGWRMLAYKDGERVGVVNRNGRDRARQFPGLASGTREAVRTYARVRRLCGDLRRAPGVAFRVGCGSRIRPRSPCLPSTWSNATAGT